MTLSPRRMDGRIVDLCLEHWGDRFLYESAVREEARNLSASEAAAFIPFALAAFDEMQRRSKMGGHRKLA